MVETARQSRSISGKRLKRKRSEEPQSNNFSRITKRRFISHLPSVRPREHAFLRRFRPQQPYPECSDSDSIMSGPTTRAPTIVRFKHTPKRHVHL